MQEFLGRSEYGWTHLDRFLFTFVSLLGSTYAPSIGRREDGSETEVFVVFVAMVMHMTRRTAGGLCRSSVPFLRIHGDFGSWTNFRKS